MWDKAKSNGTGVSDTGIRGVGKTRLKKNNVVLNFK